MTNEIFNYRILFTLKIKYLKIQWFLLSETNTIITLNKKYLYLNK